MLLALLPGAAVDASMQGNTRHFIFIIRKADTPRWHYFINTILHEAGAIIFMILYGEEAPALPDTSLDGGKNTFLPS